MIKFESLAAKLLPANVTKEINEKSNHISNFTNEVENYAGVANKVADGAQFIKPVTSTVKTINNVTEVVNRPAKVLLNKTINTISNEIGNPLSPTISSLTKVDGQHTANLVSSNISRPAGNWATEKLTGLASGISSISSLGLIGEANVFSQWWWVSQASNVSEIVADNAELINQTKNLAGKVNHYASETNKAFNRISNRQEQPERDAEYHTLNQEVVYSEDNEEVIINKFNNGKEVDTYNSLKSFTDNEEEVIVIASKDELLWNDPRSWYDQLFNNEELFGNEERTREMAEEKERFEVWEEVENELEINENWESTELEVEEAESWQSVDQKEIEQETDKEWIDFEEAVRMALEKSKIFKTIEKVSDSLNSARKVVQGVEKTVPKVQEDYILRNVTPIVVKNTADYIAKNIGCGTEIAARYIEEVTADNEKFAEFLSQVKETASSIDHYLAKVKKATDKVVGFSRKEEYNALNNLPGLYSANEKLKSSSDEEFEESLVITNKELSTTSEELPIPGAFKSDDEKEELFGNEEFVKRESQLQIAIEEARFEEIVNSMPGAWNHASLQEEDSEDNEVFYDALEEQENNKEEVPQQKALTEVKAKTSNKWFSPFSWPIKIK